MLSTRSQRHLLSDAPKQLSDFPQYIGAEFTVLVGFDQIALSHGKAQDTFAPGRSTRSIIPVSAEFH